MNLVVKEWAVVAQRPGVAVISETAGVAAITADTALLVSPLDIEGTARAIERALGMPEEERASRLAKLRESVYSWNASDWLSAQLAELKVTRAKDMTVIGKAFWDVGRAPKDQSNRRKRLPQCAVWEIHPVMALQINH